MRTSAMQCHCYIDAKVTIMAFRDSSMNSSECSVYNIHAP